MAKSLGEIARKNFGLPHQQKKDEIEEVKKQTQQEKKYWEKVDNFKINQNRELSLKELKINFLINADELIMNTTQNGQFLIDDQNKDLLNCLCDYFTLNENFQNYKCVLKSYKETDEEGNILNVVNTNPSTKKGIMVVGNYGFGKTIIFKAFQKTFLPIKSQNRFGIVSSIEILSNYYKNKTSDLSKYYKSTWYFDDVGHEKAAYNKDELMEDILFQRYHLFQNRGIKTHISTNFSLKLLKEKYGDYIYSRLFEMFNIIFVDGVDRRKNKNKI